MWKHWSRQSADVISTGCRAKFSPRTLGPMSWPAPYLSARPDVDGRGKLGRMHRRSRYKSERGRSKAGDESKGGGALSSELLKVSSLAVVDFSLVAETELMTPAAIFAPYSTPDQQGRRWSFRELCQIACTCELTFGGDLGFRVRCRVAEASRHFRHAIEHAANYL